MSGFDVNDLKRRAAHLDDNVRQKAKSIGAALLNPTLAFYGAQANYAASFLDVPEQQLPTPGAVPTLDDARARLQTAQDLRQRRGRAASILSERPASPLGYTGGGRLATQLLGGGT